MTLRTGRQWVSQDQKPLPRTSMKLEPTLGRSPVRASSGDLAIALTRVFNDEAAFLAASAAFLEKRGGKPST